MSNIAVPLEKIKESMRTMWMAGDFGVIAKLTLSAAEEFVKRLALPSDARVLDFWVSDYPSPGELSLRPVFKLNRGGYDAF